MNISLNVHVSAVFDATMLVTSGHVLNPVIGHSFISKNHRLWHHVLTHITEQCRTFDVGSNTSNDTTLALSHADDGSFLCVASQWPASTVFARAAVIGFIHLHRFALQLHVRLGQQRANLAEHAPSGFVSDSSFALNLLCRDAATSRSHQVHGVVPEPERRAAVLE